MSSIQNSVPRSQDLKFLHEMNQLSKHHYLNSVEYRRIVDSLFSGVSEASHIGELPFLPVTLFKEFELKSVPEGDIFKILLSSGTAGAQSKIYLSQQNARKQSEVLHELFKNKFGSTRVPMIVFDSPTQISSVKAANARTAAVIGFSGFASKRHFVLDEDLTLNWDYLEELSEFYEDQYVMFFGFTFILWKTLFLEDDRDRSFRFKKSALLHGGGWKKLESLNVQRNEFRSIMSAKLGLTKVFDYYGMAEQAGSIYFECTAGYFHTTAFGKVLIRDMVTLRPLDFGVTGIIQVLSTIPTSYPGHSLLTQDLGTAHGVDDCICGEVGTYFTIQGRIPKSEMRGCSDVLA